MKNCPACGGPYAHDSFSVITEGEKGSLVSMQCPTCRLDVLILITTMPFGLVGTGLPTDCTPDEIPHFIAHTEISSDDVIEVHSLLEISRSETLNPNIT